MCSASPVVELDAAVVRFAAVTAVNGIGVNVASGEIFTLLGPNGAGKTTTIELCEGFIAPDSGTVRVLGLDPIRQREALTRRIGMMPQAGGAYPGVRAMEMLRLVASYYRDPLDPAWLAQTLGIDAYAKTTYRRLSGGQAQRLALACALVGRPELVFLDEPTAGMDAQSRYLVWELLRSLRRDGVTVILTTHLMDEAEALSDRVAIMDHGDIVALGTPQELTTSGFEQHVRLVTDTPLDLDGLAQVLPDAAEADVESATHLAITHPITPELIALVATECARQGVLVKDLRVAQRTLEDVFLDLTGRELRP